MPDRRLSTERTRARDAQRSIEDRLARLENGGVFNGRVSLGEHIVIGGIDFVVTTSPDGTKNLRLENPATGATYIITV